MPRLPSGIRSNISKLLNFRKSPASSTEFYVALTRKTKPEPYGSFRDWTYYPVNIGDIYNQRYRVVRPLGWGLYSTVWQVKDLETQTERAIKILIGELSNDDIGFEELAILKALRDRNPRADGYPHICHIHEDFTLDGPEASHTCLVFELMGATVLDVFSCLPGQAMPLWLVKRISKQTLLALKYMHECDMVHTDIKPDNIMMTIIPCPPFPPKGILVNREAFESTVFKLGDMGSTNRLTNIYAPCIQPEALRCPEVILDGKWDTKADIWNFGCLMYEFARGARLFQPQWNIEESGLTSYENHLAQMVGLLGEFPRMLLDSLPGAERYFNAKGQLLKGTKPYAVTLERLLRRGGHSPDDIPLAADFFSKALIFDPAQRWSATQLLKHPWLEGVN